MIHFEYSLTLAVRSPDENEEQILAEVDRVMQELLILEELDAGVTDAAVSLDLAARQVVIELTVRGDSFEDAQRNADSSIRCAIHAAGGGTPNWTDGWKIVQKEQRVDLEHA